MLNISKVNDWRLGEPRTMLGIIVKQSVEPQDTPACKSCWHQEKMTALDAAGILVRVDSRERKLIAAWMNLCWVRFSRDINHGLFDIYTQLVAFLRCFFVGDEVGPLLVASSKICAMIFKLGGFPWDAWEVYRYPDLGGLDYFWKEKSATRMRSWLDAWLFWLVDCWGLWLVVVCHYSMSFSASMITQFILGIAMTLPPVIHLAIGWCWGIWQLWYTKIWLSKELVMRFGDINSQQRTSYYHQQQLWLQLCSFACIKNYSWFHWAKAVEPVKMVENLM